jgi:hypothetical protein
LNTTQILYGAGSTDICLNPVELGRNILEAGISCDRAFQVLDAQNNFENELEAIESQFKRVHFDVLGALPEVITSKILFGLGEKEVRRFALVSRSWYNITSSQYLWKKFCNHRGWGLIFSLPKQLNWQRLYKVLASSLRKKIEAALEIFKYDIAGISAMNSPKKVSQCLRKLPELLKLEKSEPTRINDLVQLEIVNSILISLEAYFTSTLENMLSILENPVEMQSVVNSQRFKAAEVSFLDDKGLEVAKVRIHELILERSGKYRILNSHIEKSIRNKRHVDSHFSMNLSLNVSASLQSYVNVGEIGMDKTPSSFKLFGLLGRLYKILLSFKAGVPKGKHTQFQSRFTYSIDIICRKMRDKIEDLRAKKASIIGNCILRTFVLDLSGPLKSYRRGNIIRKWSKSISEDLPVSLDDVCQRLHPFKNFAHRSSSIFNSCCGIGIFHSCESHLLILDPSGFALDILKSVITGDLRVLEISNLLTKEYLTPLKDHEILFFVGKLWTPQIVSEINAFLNIKAPEMHDKNARAIIFCPSKYALDILELPFKVLDWSEMQETSASQLFDILMKLKTPMFHQELVLLQKVCEETRENLEIRYQELIVLVSKNQELDETLLYDIIIFERDTLALEALDQKKTSLSSEMQAKYLPYEKFVEFAVNLWSAITNVNQLGIVCVFSWEMFLEEYLTAIEHFPEDFNELVSSKCESAARVLAYRVSCRTAQSMPQYDRMIMLLIFNINLMEFQNLLNKQDKQNLLDLTGKSRNCANIKEFYDLIIHQSVENEKIMLLGLGLIKESNIYCGTETMDSGLKNIALSM